MNASSESGLCAIVIRIEPGIVLHQRLLPVVGGLLRQFGAEPHCGPEDIGSWGSEFLGCDLIEQFLM